MNHMRRSCLIIAAGAVFFPPKYLFAAAQSILRRPACSPVGPDSRHAADAILRLVSRWLAERNSRPSLCADRWNIYGSGVLASPGEGWHSPHAQVRRLLATARTSVTDCLRCWASRRPVGTQG